jgi:hypothetical protein
MAESKTGRLPSRKRDWFAVDHFCAWLAFGTIFYLGDELDRLLGLWLFLIPLLATPCIDRLLTIPSAFAGSKATVKHSCRHRLSGSCPL